MVPNNWTSIYKTVNLDTDLTSFRKILPKLIISLNVKCRTIKLEDDVGEILDDPGFGCDILEFINWNSLQLKNSVLQKTLSSE